MSYVDKDTPITIKNCDSTEECIVTPRVDITISHEGWSYTLDPKEDLTPIELYRITEWKDCVRGSEYVYRRNVSKFFLDLAKRLQILRHFTKKEINNG